MAVVHANDSTFVHFESRDGQTDMTLLRIDLPGVDFPDGGFVKEFFS